MPACRVTGCSCAIATRHAHTASTGQQCPQQGCRTHAGLDRQPRIALVPRVDALPLPCAREDSGNALRMVQNNLAYSTVDYLMQSATRSVSNQAYSHT